MIVIWLQEEVYVSQVIVNAHRLMATDGVPAWLNGTTWLKYDPISEMGAYINTNQFKSERISFQRSCKVIMDAKQLSVVPEIYTNPDIRLNDG